MRATFVISGTISQDMTSLVRKRKKQLVFKKEKNEKDLCIHHHIVGTDSLHSPPN
jgi:ketosteroid isomerase-like protein